MIGFLTLPYSFVRWHHEFTRGTGKFCPGKDVMEATDDILARARAIMKMYQTATGPVADRAFAAARTTKAAEGVEVIEVPAGAVVGDGTEDCPADFPVKGNAQSGIYHVPGGDRTIRPLRSSALPPCSTPRRQGIAPPGTKGVCSAAAAVCGVPHPYPPPSGYPVCRAGRGEMRSGSTEVRQTSSESRIRVYRLRFEKRLLSIIGVKQRRS